MLARFLNKLSLLVGRRRYAVELDEEMAFHRAQAETEFVAAGMTPEAARYAAMRQFGNAGKLREQSHDVIRFRFETVMQDLRFALRQLRRNPGFAMTAVLILALGMGVSVAMFGFVDAALLQPLPFEKPNRIVSVDERSALFPRSNLSRHDYDDWKRMNTTLIFVGRVWGNGVSVAPRGDHRTGARGARERWVLHDAGRASVAGTGVSSRRGPSWVSQGRIDQLWRVDEAIWRAAGHRWAVGQPERRRVHDCRRAAAFVCVCAAREPRVLGSAAGQERLRATQELPQPGRRRQAARTE